MGMVGSPAMFELAFGYAHREELESLLLRLQMAINSANLEETRNCLLIVRAGRMVWVSGVWLRVGCWW